MFSLNFRQAVLCALFGCVLAVVSGQARAAVGDENKITCMYPVWLGFGPVHLANELGYFKDEGIEVVELIDDDMPNAMAAMERGDIDCYLRTVGEYQGLGRRKDTQGTIIGTIDLSTGGDLYTDVAPRAGARIETDRRQSSPDSTESLPARERG